MTLASLLLIAGSLLHPTQDTSFKHTWAFQATSAEPSASLDGTLDLRFDSASYVAGVIVLGKQKLPFHGRHLGARLALRTDDGFSPVIRIDANADTAHTSFSGVLQSSKVHATDARHRSADLYNVMFEFFAVRK